MEGKLQSLENLFGDEKLLKVLSSGTRMQILRILCMRQMTVSDLSRKMKFCKSTLHEHLKRLLDAELVYKISGRKWVYYKISKKGSFVIGMIAL